jgi:baculoviral IAP repeat-containing protein 6
MKDVVDSYSKRLNTSKKVNKSKAIGKTVDDLDDEGLAQLIPDIQSTATIVEVRDLRNCIWLNSSHF